MINYAEEKIKIKLDKDIERHFNENYLRLLVCKWVYHPVGDCERYQNKVADLIRYVGGWQLSRGVK